MRQREDSDKAGPAVCVVVHGTLRDSARFQGLPYPFSRPTSRAPPPSAAQGCANAAGAAMNMEVRMARGAWMRRSGDAHERLL
jgi:hypothetical protein